MFFSNDEYLNAICSISIFRAKKLKAFFDYNKNLLFSSSIIMVEKNEKELNEIVLAFSYSCKKSEENGIHLPFFSLIKNKRLSKFAVHYIFTALSWELSPEFCQIIKSIKYFKTIKTPNDELISALYEVCCPLDGYSFFYSKNEIKDLLKIFFITENNSPYTGYRLHPAMKSFLLNYEQDIPYYCEMSLCNSAPISKEFSDIIYALKGKKGSGRKHFLKQKNENFLFCNQLLFFDNKNNSLSNSISYIILLSYLYNLSVCFCDIDYYDTHAESIIGLISMLHKYKINVYLTFEKNISEKIKNKYTCIIKEIDELSFEQKLNLLEKNTKLEKNIASDIVSSFKLSPEQIISASNEITFKNAVSKKDCFKCCLNQTSMNLSNLAQKIEAAFTWDDLVLDFSIIKNIKSACSYIKYRHTIYDLWEFSKRISYGKGLNILFTGPPGTGKTMLSQVIANDLDMELYRIDLSSVVSKYIGETEENIGKIFDEAENGNCILFFDEMDSLFGKRSETQDARDKYANMETAYILQRIEAYDGVVIMATNYLTNIDEAFMRRIHFIFHIPLPDSDLRYSLWKKSFPAKAPLDKNIDFNFLSTNFELSGASIKNIAVSAAVFAAQDNSNISMAQILKALKLEMKKQNKALLKSDFKQYSYMLED